MLTGLPFFLQAQIKTHENAVLNDLFFCKCLYYGYDNDTLIQKNLKLSEAYFNDVILSKRNTVELLEYIPVVDSVAKKYSHLISPDVLSKERLVFQGCLYYYKQRLIYKLLK
jgi:hypothetical protein